MNGADRCGAYMGAVTEPAGSGYALRCYREPGHSGPHLTGGAPVGLPDYLEAYRTETGDPVYVPRNHGTRRPPASRMPADAPAVAAILEQWAETEDYPGALTYEDYETLSTAACRAAAILRGEP